MSKRNRVLIVDDTPSLIKILKGILAEDYDISVATNGQDALRIASAETQPDIILLDILMPGMDGYQVLTELKAEPRTSEIPVIFVTVLSEDEDEAKGLDMGAVDYLAKPMNPAIVRARVRNHLALKERNQILRDYVRLRDEVERMTHHDLATPLATVINVPEMLMMDDNLTPEQTKVLKMVQKAGFGMLELVNRSIDLYKMEIGQYQLSPTPVSLTEVFDQIINELANMSGVMEVSISRKVTGQTAEDHPEYYLMGDKMLYYSLLSNLVRNAVEASSQGGEVIINMSVGANPLVSIHNQGCVPQEILGKFFGKFVTSSKESGTGLGTYIAKLIADTLGGELEMESSQESGTYLYYKPMQKVLHRDSL